MLSIRELTEAPALDRAQVENFLVGREFPLVEGRQVTFVYRGPAQDVCLRHWIFGLPSSQAFSRVQGTPDLWYLVMELPERSRVEYKLELVQNGQRQLVRDPLNPHLANDPFGANSVVHASGYETPDWVTTDPDARPGEVIERRIASTIFGDTREIQIYKPARFRQTRRYSLLIVHDGADYMRFASLRSVLDNLIHRHELSGTIVVMTSSRDRMQEYAGDPRHGDFIVHELLPLLEEEFPLAHDVDSRCLLGASFGAVAALATAWRHPGVFGKLMLQSGSFVFADIGRPDMPPVFDPVVDFVKAFRESPGKLPPEMYLSCGTYESLIVYNRAMVPFLRDHGVNVRFHEARDGHNWENWRDRLREGLTWLMPGPLWLVYE